MVCLSWTLDLFSSWNTPGLCPGFWFCLGNYSQSNLLHWTASCLPITFKHLSTIPAPNLMHHCLGKGVHIALFKGPPWFAHDSIGLLICLKLRVFARIWVLLSNCDFIIVILIVSPSIFWHTVWHCIWGVSFQKRWTAPTVAELHLLRASENWLLKYKLFGEERMPLPHLQSSQDIFICKTKWIKYICCSYVICVTNAAFFTLTWFTKLHMNS